MFWTRVISAIIFAALVILVIESNLWFYFALVSIVVVISTLEFSKLVWSKDNLLLGLLIVFFAWLICFSSFKPDWINTDLVLCLAIGLIFVYEIAKRKPQSALLNISAALFGIFYVGWLFGRHLILIRQMPDPYSRQIIYFLIGVAWSGDIGAYLIGRRFGKHKIIPVISPGKSLEGFIAGIIFSVATALAIRYWLPVDIGLSHVIVLGVGLTVIGQIGDLAESLLKRGANVKDSGKIMPGHGGLLDRCDSLIFITPALYYYSVYILHLNK